MRRLVKFICSILFFYYYKALTREDASPLLLLINLLLICNSMNRTKLPNSTYVTLQIKENTLTLAEFVSFFEGLRSRSAVNYASTSSGCI